MPDEDMRVLTVLRALLMGLPIQVGPQTFQMDAGNRLCVQGRNETTGETVLIAVNFGTITLDEFIRWTRQISEDDATRIGLTTALNEGRRRE